MKYDPLPGHRVRLIGVISPLLLLRSSAICFDSSSPLFGLERPGGTVGAESIPFRIRRIHYLCLEVTLFSSEY